MTAPLSAGAAAAAWSPPSTPPPAFSPPPAPWIAPAMTDGDRRAAEEANGDTLKVPDNEIYVRFVVVPRNVYQRHYYVFCNPLLWFLQHYMWNTPRTPNIGRAVYEAWESGYIPVNEAIADAIAAETVPPTWSGST